MQRFLAGKDGDLSKETILALWAQRKPIILLGTIWPDRYQSYFLLSERAEGSTAQRKDQALGVLRLAQRVFVEDEFTAAEKAAAEALAESDVRIKIALRDTYYGVTQVLAGAPALVEAWRHADPYSKALITSAIDIRRIGIEGDLTPSLLAHAARVYLTGEQVARADADWFEVAIRYCLTRNQGATSVLIPTSGLGYGVAAGYDLADYLTSHGLRLREDMPIPIDLWDVLAEQIYDPIDLQELASAADVREVKGYAEAIYRRALALGNAESGFWLGLMLHEQGREEEALHPLRQAAIMGNGDAFEALVDYLPASEAIIELQNAIEAGRKLPQYDARLRLADLLDKLGKTEEAEREYLQAIAEERKHAVFTYALRLDQKGEEVQALEWYLRAVEAGDTSARFRACLILMKNGRAEEAIALQRDAPRSDGDDVSDLIGLLVQAGRFDEAGDLAEAKADYFSLGRALQATGKTEEAFAVYDRMIRTGDAWGHVYKADLLESLDRYHDALPHRIKGLAVGSFFTGYALVNNLAHSGDLDTAVFLYQSYFSKGIDVMSDGLAAALLEAGRLPELVKMVGLAAIRGKDAGGHVHQLCRVLESHGHGEYAAALRRHGFTAEGVPVVPMPQG
jgi:tetratricopeptide (TPR) repeat protein